MMPEHVVPAANAGNASAFNDMRFMVWFCCALSGNGVTCNLTAPEHFFVAHILCEPEKAIAQDAIHRMSQKTYRIGEAAAALNLKTYVLRFWETEFPQIVPVRTEKGQRLYTESDIAVLGRIRYLLHERGLTIDGARRLLREEAARGVTYTQAGAPVRDGMEETLEYPADELADDSDPAADAARAPVQGTLFQAAADAIPADSALPTLSAAEGEFHFIITELAAIRRLLISDTQGDMP